MRSLFIKLHPSPFIAAIVFLVGADVHAQPDAWSHGELKWNTISTQHFDVHYHDDPYSTSNRQMGPRRTAEEVAQIAERIFDPVTTLYRYKPERVHFIIRDTDDYSNGGAYYYDNKIEIWATSLDYELRGNHHWLRNVVTHEFVHMVSLQAAMKWSRRLPAFYVQFIGYEEERRKDVLRGFPNVFASFPFPGVSMPVWFAEGVAQYQLSAFDYEFWDSHRDMILRSAVLSGNMLSLNDMSTFGKNSIGNESAYNSGYAFVSYLASRFGEEVVDRISSESAKPFVSFESAVKRATGYALDSLYGDWTTLITTRYVQRTSLAGPVTHDVLHDGGTANFHPSPSPDGTELAYLSNVGYDYLGQTSLYLRNLKTGKTRKVTDRAIGPISWTKDGEMILYTRNTPENSYKRHLNDVYAYHIRSDKQIRVSRSLRAFSAILGESDSTLYAIINVDGTNNIIRISGLQSISSLKDHFTDSTGLPPSCRIERLTRFADGRQFYTLALHPTANQLWFDTSIDDGRDIGYIDLSSGEMKLVLQSACDERTPAFSSDGTILYYVSDRSGIFNLYRRVLSSGAENALTNVSGGVFNPSCDVNGRMYLSLYEDNGFKIIATAAGSEVPTEALMHYGAENPNIIGRDYPSRWPQIRTLSYDSVAPVPMPTSKYTTRFTDFSWLPVVRIDYGSIKPGFYFYSSDVLSKSSLFGGALVNFSTFDRDLFSIFEYSGFGPTVFLELYNLTRTRRFNETPADTASGLKFESTQRNTFELREFDVGIDFGLLKPRDLRLAFAHPELFVQITDYRELEQSFPNTGLIKYFYGNDFSARWMYSDLIPSIDGEINPRGGRKSEVTLSYNFDNLIKGFAFNAGTGATEELYEKGYHPRVELRHTEFVPVPSTTHTLEIAFMGGVVPAKVDSFYNFFGGGLPGLRGYSFYSIEGNKLFVANATYRFPLLRRIDSRLSVFSLDKIFLGVYGGIGNAWSHRRDAAEWKRAIGAELRVEMNAFYVYPTRINFMAAYGLDRFSTQGPLVSKYDALSGGIFREPQRVRNGKEWRLYLTVLFGFTLFDDH